MEIGMGDKIRQLRKNKHMTQEQLAERVGISFQAISKWENNIALPEIVMLPKLAKIFGVSIDEFFSYSQEQMHQDIQRYVDEAYLMRETDPERGRRILEEGLRLYPDNDILLCNLLYCLNYSKDPDETIKAASKLIDKTELMDLRYDALRFLAYAYKAKGDEKSAMAALDQIPEIYFSKLSEMAFVLSGKEKLEAATKQKWVSVETLIQMMWKIAECHEENGELEQAAAETACALELLRVINNPYLHNYEGFLTKKLHQLQEMKHEESV